jgi:hypothetical protein
MLWPAGAPLVNKTAIERLRLRTTSRLGGHIRLEPRLPPCLAAARGKSRRCPPSGSGFGIRDKVDGCSPPMIGGATHEMVGTQRHLPIKARGSRQCASSIFVLRRNGESVLQALAAGHRGSAITVAAYPVTGLGRGAACRLSSSPPVSSPWKRRSSAPLLYVVWPCSNSNIPANFRRIRQLRPVCCPPVARQCRRPASRTD